MPRGAIIAIFVVSVTFVTLNCVFAEPQVSQESDQQIKDFSLAGYGEKGKKSWDLAGRTADIFNEVIKLQEVNGNLYGKEEDVNLTAERGDFNKVSGKVHLEQNVVITTSSGARLTTDSLDWDRKTQVVSTKDFVNIEKENMVTTAYGAVGKPNLNSITLERDVKVEMNPKGEQKGQEIANKDKMVITCDGPLEIDYEKNIATFNNNVKVDRPDVQIYSDVMHVYFISGKDAGQEGKAPSSQGPTLMGGKIEKIICRGNVKIIRGENISFSEEAIYTASDKKIVLTGRPKLIIYSTESLVESSP